MSKEINKKYDLDYETLVFHGKFRRIQPVQTSWSPVLSDHWITYIEPRDSPKINSLIKSELSNTSISLKHLKRFVKTTRESKGYLKVLLCDCESFKVDDLKKMLSQALDKPQEEIIIETASIPVNKPFDKELNQQWSDKYWPIVWKGNPLIQELNESYKEFQPGIDMKYIEQIAEKSFAVSENNQIPAVSIFVDPKTDKIMAMETDTRSASNPIKHSILNCIEKIANDELEHRKQKAKLNDNSPNNYLCLNYHVYTTHEPCTMCSMALLHSRISKLTYIKDSKTTGAIGPTSGSGYMIHLSCSLNWKFESYKYIKGDLEVPDVLDDHAHI